MNEKIIKIISVINMHFKLSRRIPLFCRQRHCKRETRKPYRRHCRMVSGFIRRYTCEGTLPMKYIYVFGIHNLQNHASYIF